MHANRSATPTGRLTPATLTFALRAFGAISVLFGVGVLGWLAYHGIVRQVPEVAGFTALAQALLPVALIGFGLRLMNQPLHAKRTDHDAASPAHED